MSLPRAALFRVCGFIHRGVSAARTTNFRTTWLCHQSRMASGGFGGRGYSLSPRLAFGAVLPLAIIALLAAATSQHSYQRTRLAMLAIPVILVLDVTAVAAVLLAAPVLTWTLGSAVAVSLGRIAFAARTLPRLAAR